MTEYKKFKFTVGSDDVHEKLAAEIIYESNFIAELTQENGFDNLMIELFYPSNTNKPFCKCRLDDFLEVINMAKRKLGEVSGIE
jgi:hypothetical protein